MGGGGGGFVVVFGLLFVLTFSVFGSVGGGGLHGVGVGGGREVVGEVLF